MSVPTESDLPPSPLTECISRWNPKGKNKVHCSNCRYCKVTTSDIPGGEPIVYCSMGFGNVKPLTQLVRKPYGKQFRDARKCEYFDSMNDDAASEDE